MLSYYTYTPQASLKTSLIVTISTYTSSRGLILYQAYGNLYAMTGRKAHLLGDNQILSLRVFALGRHLKEIHVTWAQFWKQPDKMTILLEDGLKNQDQSMETVSGKLVTPFESHSNDVWKFMTPSELAIIKEALETIAWRPRLD
ncbi:hypothetical protein Tco_1306066 [Tanacetum coccineum]